MTIKVKTGTKEFRTKTQAREYFSSMLARYSRGEDVIGEDFDDLLSLLEKHPRSKEKIGSGIKRIFRDKTKHGASCFWIERNDGTKDDFSFNICIDAAGEIS